jgi:hypothetical protein
MDGKDAFGGEGIARERIEERITAMKSSPGKDEYLCVQAAE